MDVHKAPRRMVYDAFGERAIEHQAQAKVKVQRIERFDSEHGDALRLGVTRAVLVLAKPRRILVRDKPNDFAAGNLFAQVLEAVEAGEQAAEYEDARSQAGQAP